MLSSKFITLFGGVRYPAGTIFVSKAASNGFAVGSDSNTLAQSKDASRQTPFLTVSRAVSQATTGDLIVINDGSFTTTELGAANYVDMVSKLVFLRAHRTGQVTFVGTQANRVVRITGMAAGMAGGLQGIIVDANNVSQMCLAANDANNALHTFTMTNCQTINPTVRGIDPTCTKIILNLNNHTHTATASRSLIYSTTLDAGSQINILGGSTTITQQNNPQGVIECRATATGVTASIALHTIVSTLLSSLTSTGTHDGIALYNFSSAILSDNTVAIKGHPGSRGAAGIRVSQLLAVDVTPTITDNSVLNETTQGYGILAGTDSTGIGDAHVIDPVVNDNTVTAVPANQTVGPIHGVLLGFDIGGTALRNTIVGCGLPMIQKMNTVRGALIADNTVIGPYSLGLYGKGALNTRFVHNSLYIYDTPAADAVTVFNVQDDDGGTHSTGIEFTDNAIHVAAGLTKMVNVGLLNTATFANNDYYSVPALPLNPFTYQGVSYATVALWAAAKEATAISGDPKFADPVNNDFRLQAGSACIGAGVTVVDVTTDKAGRAYASPPAIGAYEYAA